MKKRNYDWKKTMSAKEVISMLIRNGWLLSRSTGSHRIYIKNGIPVVVPYHKQIKKGTLESIKKTVNLAESNNK